MKRISDLTLITFLTCFMLAGCSSTEKLTSSAGYSSTSPSPKYSVIYVIHGDANYLYHENGKAYQADQQALMNALKAGQNATQGEVFIFHQRPEKKVLFFFPQKDRVFYHYKSGKLIQKQKYSSEYGDLTHEANLFKEYSDPEPSRTFFYYLGHEIPTKQGSSYHTSQPNLSFDSHQFAKNLRLFSDSIALTVLSTCNNANPLMLNLLAPITKAVVASPQNLHLSYMDVNSVSALEEDPTIPAQELAEIISRSSFQELSDKLYTAVTVAHYDMSKVKLYISPLSKAYEQHLVDVEKSPRFTDNIDCADLDNLKSYIKDDGVTLFHKPASFGRNKSNSSHSGWGCKE
ncbi:hypothetical protein [Balneola vulgaris]|uniref:hypothetical protein n=1 Tax=Balneola vulgaris TaxID=287535 RepID=UPI0003A66878|nr:hypothetical protein [Balneola vulgaris]